MRGLHENWRAMGASANVSGMRRDAVLRQFTTSARQQTRALDRTSRHSLGPAQRTLVVLLRGRSLRRLLSHIDVGSDELYKPE